MVPAILTTPPVRVARIITRLNVGGPALHALLLSERLGQFGFQTSLVCGTVALGEEDLRTLRPTTVQAIHLPELGRRISPLQDIVALVRMVALLRRLRPAIVHTHLAKAGFIGRVAARLVGVPVVIHTYHGTVFRGYFSPRLSAFFVALERALARLTDRVIAISPSQRHELLSLGIAAQPNIIEIPLGLDLDRFRSARVGMLRAELGLATAPLVGTVARLVPIKGVDVFLRAARRVADSHPDAHFVIVGDGELAGSLRRLASDLGLAERAHFLSWRADLPSILADLDVVVSTSHSEGTPVSLIEALACGRRVVATAVGGVPDVLNSPDLGTLVPDGDADAIGDAISACVAERGRWRTRASTAGQERADAYDVSRLVTRIADLYRESLSSSTSIARVKRW